jgi:tetratricopeptide (TPR) repeat protein
MDQSRDPPGGSLAVALANARKLLSVKPALAEEQAREILKVIPGQADALLLLAGARTAQGDARGACTILEKLTETHPDSPAAWRALGDQYTLLEDAGAAAGAYARSIKASVHDPVLMRAAGALCENRLAVAEGILREFLKAHPTDVAAIRMLAETGTRLGRYEDAENLLARALELAPGFTPARYNYAMVLHRQLKSERALEQLDILLGGDPRNGGYRTLRAAALVRIGEYAAAAETYRGLLADFPCMSRGWMSFGHVLKTLGRQDECIAAYRRSIELQPSLGESYWSMANLKTFRFSDGDVAAMKAQLARADIDEDDRLHLEFALGKALEDSGEHAASFACYAEANALRRKTLDYDAGETTRVMRRTKALFTEQFLSKRRGSGCPALDPIFVVGMPRSGSTLIEQILSSHSAIEGTMELQDINILVSRLDGAGKKARPPDYPEILADLPVERFAGLGEDYLERARIQRKLGKPFFVDKMPNNFQHAGFIHLILPNARIVDARRHPMACCFSNFKQHFARGQAFAYDLDDVGRYYRDYVELMAHFDSVLPGRVHRVVYERMVADPEREIRALLAYCGLPFEDACLRFYENDRAVRTASSEQVRRPIFTTAVEHWRNYEEWLDPLRNALGPVLDAYPDVPAFADESLADPVGAS